jgi:hypothetical protein
MLTTLIVSLAAVPTMVYMFLEAHIHVVVPGQLRLYNAVDLIGMSVFYHVVFHFLFQEVFEKFKSNEASNSRREKMNRNMSIACSALYTVFQVCARD